jgi:hypothetical protein
MTPRRAMKAPEKKPPTPRPIEPSDGTVMTRYRPEAPAEPPPSQTIVYDSPSTVSNE